MLGWLYRCTQDFDGTLPASDFNGTEPKRLDNDAQLYTLNASIIQAAADGHYDDRELELLWKQKREVRRTIQQIRPNTTSSTASTASSSAYSLPASTTTSTVRTSDTELDSFNDLIQCRSTLQPIQEVHPDLEAATIELRPLPCAKPSVATPCTFRVCHNCRPVYRDRAWQSIDDILQNPYKAPPKHEIDNRRISNLHLVMNIASMKPGQRFYLQRQYDIESTRSQRNSRTEFVDTVQRLLRNKDNMPEEVTNIIRVSEAYDYGALLASESSASSTYASDDSDQPKNSRVPLYLRRGFERFSSITLPPKSASSQYAESSGLSPRTIDSTVSSPAILEQTDNSNGNDKNVAPRNARETRLIAKTFHLEKTPKATMRFPID
ncbi:hypothetical protein H2198_003918 [Neophaeococcomyces mojaviensis]|uniref:Uncharacterized protein n=1 Tax=Neophaeococcomyces mojaviensis TaxID=3383035 RepID=A0ACC3A9Z9_9EURO|nr:hypothetical protein H2198_003918 [Knufia sp. JES_112]